MYSTHKPCIHDVYDQYNLVGAGGETKIILNTKFQLYNVKDWSSGKQDISAVSIM